MAIGTIAAARRRGPSAGFANTVLLLGFEGTNGATTTSDESAAARGASTAFLTGATISTAQAKFGSSSLSLNGTSGEVTWADSNDWTFNGDFTIDAFVRFSALTGFQTICSQWSGPSSGKFSWLLDFPGSANNVLRFGYSFDGFTSNFVQKAWTPSANTWYHVAADRSGSTLRLYANGASLGSGAASGAFANVAEGLRIGAIFSGAETDFFNGFIDELRISNGIARYASDVGYTVPTAAFPRS